eukprot:jgi/Chrzof1/11048/Cz05g21200.t1
MSGALQETPSSSQADIPAPAQPIDNTDFELRSPTNSISWKVKHSKHPGSLLLATSVTEGEALALQHRNHAAPYLSPRAGSSPKLNKHEDPMMSWPSCCSPEGASASSSPVLSPLPRSSSPLTDTAVPRRALSLTIESRSTVLAAACGLHRREGSQDSVGAYEAYSPRRLSSAASDMCRSPPPPPPAVLHSHCGVVMSSSPTQHSLPAPLQSQSSSGYSCGLLSSHEDSLTGEHTGKPRLLLTRSCHWKPCGGEHLQSQTHQALQQLAKQPLRRRTSESQLHVLRAQGEVQRWALEHQQ